MSRIRNRNTVRHAALFALIVGLTLAPSIVSAGDGFTDVAEDHKFHNDILWLAGTGITAGCNPPFKDKFCPNDPVTRAQMSAFMQRLAVNQIVDAASIEGFTAAELLKVTDTIDADTIDGLDSTNLLTTTDTIDADTIDGLDSTNLLTTTDTIDADTIDGLDSANFLTTTDAIDAQSVGGTPADEIATVADVAGVPGPVYSSSAVVTTANLASGSYFAVPVGSADLKGSFADATMLVPSDFTTSNFIAKNKVDFSQPTDVVVTVWVNGSPTTVTCSFNTATADTCTSTTDVFVRAGSEVAVEVSFTESPVESGRFLFAIEAG